MSVYDTMATGFERRRALPHGVAETIRASVLQAGLPVRPRILDLGAGTGRIGHPFVRAADDYTAVDLSYGMLRAFAARAHNAPLVQADGAWLPFPDATFDAVLLIQVLSGASGWRHLLTEAMRVLRPAGALIVGRVVAPDDGIDAQMKFRLAEILHDMDVHPYRNRSRDDALSWLIEQMPDPTFVTAAFWVTERTPGAFLDRHPSGARFSCLDEQVRQHAIRLLTDWATGRFGSLDTKFTEKYQFELIIHRSPQGITI